MPVHQSDRSWRLNVVKACVAKRSFRGTFIDVKQCMSIHRSNESELTKQAKHRFLSRDLG